MLRYGSLIGLIPCFPLNCAYLNMLTPQATQLRLIAFLSELTNNKHF